MTCCAGPLAACEDRARGRRRRFRRLPQFTSRSAGAIPTSDVRRVIQSALENAMVSHRDVDVKFSVVRARLVGVPRRAGGGHPAAPRRTMRPRPSASPRPPLLRPTTTNDGPPSTAKESTLTSKRLCPTMNENQSALVSRNLSGSEAVLPSPQVPSLKLCGNLESQISWLGQRGLDSASLQHRIILGRVTSAREDSAPRAWHAVLAVRAA